MIFGSWGYTKNEMTLHVESGLVDSKHFTEDFEWELLTTVAQNFEKKYACCEVGSI